MKRITAIRRIFLPVASKQLGTRSFCATARNLGSLRAVIGAALLASSLALRAAVVFDNLSNVEGGNTNAQVTTTGNTPNYYMGDAYTLTPGTTAISGFDIVPANLSGFNFTSLRVTIYVWGSVNLSGTVNTSTPAFGNLLTSYTFTSSGTFNTGFYFPIKGSPVGTAPGVPLPTPLAIPSNTIGISINCQGTTDGITYSNYNHLTSLIQYGTAASVGSQVFEGFYRNANSETDGNFTSSLRSLSLTNQGLALRIFGEKNLVTTTADSGLGSLRDVVAGATAGQTITFAPNLSGQTITLTTGEIPLTKNLTIDASALTTGISISGNNNSRVFNLASGVTNVFIGLTLTNGLADVGGAIQSSGTLTLKACALVGNRAGQGGALQIFGGECSLLNSTVAFNSATNNGGAIDNSGFNSAGTLALVNSTIFGNHAGGDGGGIANYLRTLSLANSIVASNTAAFTGDLKNFAGSTVDRTGMNIVQTYSNAGTDSGLAAITAPPLLAALGNYGGSTLTLPPLPGSPAIDAGSNSIASSLTSDQRGFTRILGARVDLGAVELSPVEATAGFFPIRWAVGNSNWDAVTFNWTDVAANVSTNYSSGRGLIFDDFASGASPLLVTNTLAITNGGILFSNSAKAYTLYTSATGAGVISNTVPILKLGTGTLTIASTNPLYGGRFTLAQGTLALPVGAALGSAASGALLICSNNTAVALGSSGNTTPAIPVLIGAGANVTNTANALGTGFNGDITSADAAGSINNSSSISYGGNLQGFTGTLIVNSGTTRFTKGANGATDLGSSNAVFIVNSSSPGLQPRNMNTTVHLGALSGTGTLGGSQTTTAGNTTTYRIGALNQSTTFAGTFVQANGNTNVAITKVGSGTLTLSGNSTNTGATTVSAGALLLTTSGSLSNSAVTVASGATNGVTIATPGGSTTVSNLTYAAGTAYLNFDFGTNAPSASVAPLQVRGNLALNGPLNISLAGNNLLLGNYPLISYAGSLSGPGPAVLLSSPVSYAITNDPVNKIIYLTSSSLQTGPTTLMVLNPNNSGPYSLRQAVLDAPSGSTIVFTNTLSGQTILLTNGQITLDKNLTIDGGGLSPAVNLDGYHNSRIFAVNSGVTCTISGLTVSNGYDNGAEGGGILNSGTLTVRRSSFLGNSATFNGGAIRSAGSLILSGCTFSGNTANEGGAVRSTSSLLLADNCTFTANSASIGGACSIADGGPTAQLQQLTVVSNTATGFLGGGGLFFFNKPTVIQNCIISGNQGVNGPDVNFVQETLTASGVNLIGNLSASTMTAGSNVIVGAPLLAPLGNYGGPTLTMPPLPGSPAIDAGDDSVTNLFAFDQRGAGFPRMSGAHVDIGAVEVQIILAGSPPQLVNTTTLGTGAFQFSFTSAPGASLTVWGSTNVALPFAQWSNLGAPVESPAGNFTFTDTQAPNNPQRFYRVSSP